MTATTNRLTYVSELRGWYESIDEIITTELINIAGLKVTASKMGSELNPTDLIIKDCEEALEWFNLAWLHTNSMVAYNYDDAERTIMDNSYILHICTIVMTQWPLLSEEAESIFIEQLAVSYLSKSSDALSFTPDAAKALVKEHPLLLGVILRTLYHFPYVTESLPKIIKLGTEQ